MTREKRTSLRTFERRQVEMLCGRLRDQRRFIQVLAGPRQVGKTTAVLQALKKVKSPHLYHSAEEAYGSPAWIEQRWSQARVVAKSQGECILVIDEIHKLPQWSEVIKRLWDEDTRERRQVKVVLLGSAPLLIPKGLSESMAGRFELISFPHWSYLELKKAFRFSWQDYILYGAYPGSVSLIKQFSRWREYIRESLVEATLNKDILLVTRVDRPGLLRRLFELGVAYAAQELSYNKILGQLQDVGNVTTLAHYLDLLNGSGLLSGLQKYARDRARKRGSSPKWLPYNTALKTAWSGLTPREIQSNPELWGHWCEAAVGAYLANQCFIEKRGELFYWRDGQEEVDFVVESGSHLLAIEVKSSRRRAYHSGSAVFKQKFPHATLLLVGEGGIAFEEFFSRDLNYWRDFA